MDARFGGAWPLLFRSSRLQALPQGARAKLKDAAETVDTRRGAALQRDQIIAALHFGFWCRMLDKRYDDVVWHWGLHAAFPHLPQDVDRERLRRRMNGIRAFRNRVFHHEPVFTARPKHNYQNIIETIGWMCPHIAATVHHMSDVDAVIAARPS